MRERLRTDKGQKKDRGTDMFEPGMVKMLLEGTRDTLYMTLVSTFFGYVIGLPVGILLTISDKEGMAMTEEWFKKIIRAAIESFPINSKRKEVLLKRVAEECKGKKEDE